MEILFDTDKMERIVPMSRYNHNYYHLPYSVHECSALYENAEDDCEEVEYYLGEIVDGKFVSKIGFWGDSKGNVDLLNNKL